VTTLVGLVVALQLALIGGPRTEESAAPRPVPAQDAPQAPRTALEGAASWYGVQGRVGAADRRLQRFLGPRWRGQSVVVCRTDATSQACVRVRLITSCGCPGRRLIDLSPSAFAVLAPLSVGVVSVSVARLPAIPATDR